MNKPIMVVFTGLVIGLTIACSTPTAAPTEVQEPAPVAPRQEAPAVIPERPPVEVQEPAPAVMQEHPRPVEVQEPGSEPPQESAPEPTPVSYDDYRAETLVAEWETVIEDYLEPLEACTGFRITKENISQISVECLQEATNE